MKRVSFFLLVCALALSGVAAYYSIVGLATIFSSAFTPVVIMASVLEISKLVVASWLYHAWDRAPVLLKTYLTSAVVVLMMITSLGIFGFLSRAHTDQNLVNQSVQLKIEQIDSKVTGIKSTIARYENQLTQLDRSINIQLDANRAQGALNARRQQEAERKLIREKLDAEQNTLNDLNNERTHLRQQTSQLESKLGPIRYVAEFFSTGKSVDLESSVRYMILVIVLVFDPLAVLMIIAANMSLGRSVSDKTQPQPYPLPNTGPAVGETRWDHQLGAFAYWDGELWKSVILPQPQIEIPPVPAPPPLDPETLVPVVKKGMDTWLEENMSVVSSVDVDSIRSTVEEAVKSSLKKDEPISPPLQEPESPKPPRHAGIDQK